MTAIGKGTPLIFFLKFLVGAAFCLAVSFSSCIAEALEATPFYTQNQGPLIQIFGLPSIGEGIILPRGKADGRFIVDLANTYIDDSNPRESILLDGETTRFTLQGRYGIGGGLEFGAEVPYVIQGGGFLDSFIENYHSAFGFPNAGREKAPRNRLLYRYERDGKVIFNMDRSGNGLGDIKLLGGWQIYVNDQRPVQALALRGSLKFPTGDSSRLLGSGSTDFALWVVGTDEYALPVGRLTVFGAAGAMVMTEGDILSEQQRPLVGFGSLGLGWTPFRWLALKIQANAHTPFYRDSDLRELNMSSVQLTVGGTLALSKKTSLDLGISEDVIVQTSPDVVFHVALRHLF